MKIMTVVNLLLGKGEAIYRVKSWEKIEREYKTLIGQGWNQQPMADLVTFIRENGLEDKLYAATEEATLVISNNKKINAQRKTLYITYDSLDKVWVFKYYKGDSLALTKKPEADIQVYDGESGIEQFTTFVDQMEWIKSA
jgi:hypothetical protein